MSGFGSSFLPNNKFTFPLKMISSKMPVGVTYRAGVSAQLKSSVILAGLNSNGDTKIIEQVKSRDHTENFLKENKSVMNIKPGIKKIINIRGKKQLKPFNVDVPGDPSSAAFFSALTLLNPNSSLKIKSVGLNPTKISFYKL